MSAKFGDEATKDAADRFGIGAPPSSFAMKAPTISTAVDTEAGVIYIRISDGEQALVTVGILPEVAMDITTQLLLGARGILSEEEFIAAGKRQEEKIQAMADEDLPPSK